MNLATHIPSPLFVKPGFAQKAVNSWRDPGILSDPVRQALGLSLSPRGQIGVEGLGVCGRLPPASDRGTRPWRGFNGKTKQDRCTDVALAQLINQLLQIDLVGRVPSWLNGYVASIVNREITLPPLANPVQFGGILGYPPILDR